MSVSLRGSERTTYLLTYTDNYIVDTGYRPVTTTGVS